MFSHFFSKKNFFILFFPILLGMRKKYIVEIRDNYPFYTKLLADKKLITERDIDIDAPSSNVNFLEHICKAAHVSLPNEISFIVKVRADNHKRFEFKLMCKDLYKEPYFRFESHGATHRNHVDSLHLPDQQIIPPHFHRFDEKGYNVAYKTPELLDEKKAAALEDIALCIVHYCFEGNIRIDEDDFPNITIGKGKGLFAGIVIDTNPNIEDPNRNVTFN